jgi:hypothetical protein
MSSENSVEISWRKVDNMLWIRRLFCSHKWRLVNFGRYTRDGQFGYGHYQDYICDKCLKKIKVSWK